MAPAAISEVPNGKQMEELSDGIDSVNVLKAELKEKSFQEKSLFDSEKDKSIFRRYEISRPEMISSSNSMLK
jgi:hypothetical protein